MYNCEVFVRKETMSTGSEAEQLSI